MGFLLPSRCPPLPGLPHFASCVVNTLDSRLACVLSPELTLGSGSCKIHLGSAHQLPVQLGTVQVPGYSLVRNLWHCPFFFTPSFFL